MKSSGYGPSSHYMKKRIESNNQHYPETLFKKSFAIQQKLNQQHKTHTNFGISNRGAFSTFSTGKLMTP